MGYWEYEPIAREFGAPIVVTGFEPLDLLQCILQAVRQLEAGEARVENAYGRAVTMTGNREAQATIGRVFEECDRQWRGIGLIPMSGWRLRPEFAAFDAERRFDLAAIRPQESPRCRAGLVLQGLLKPADCPAFGRDCTPDHPLGATMVSGEGACAAYYRYRRDEVPA
jgi:hydrogenase expression/formation protein HypD